MRHVARRTVTVDHAQRRVTDVRELVKHARRNVYGLSSRDRHTFITEAHFAASFQDEVDLFLLLVMPRYLPSQRFERDVPQREIRRLNGAGTPDNVLRQTPGRIAASSNAGQVCNNHSTSISQFVRLPRKTGGKTPFALGCT